MIGLSKKKSCEDIMSTFVRAREGGGNGSGEQARNFARLITTDSLRRGQRFHRAMFNSIPLAEQLKLDAVGYFIDCFFDNPFSPIVTSILEVQ